jgi:hypothetical protein
MMFKDEFQLDFINVEELGMREEEVDGRVIENNIVMKLELYSLNQRGRFF